jgi:hypothetical protein
MKANYLNEEGSVKRITVDEKMQDDLIRLLICELPQGVKDFSEEEAEWSEEKDCFVTPDDYDQKMGIPKSKVKHWSWESLREGQVFLSGNFVTVKRGKHRRFAAGRKRKNFLSIEDVVKEEVKRLYSQVLRGGE